MSWQSCRLGDVITLQRGHDLPNERRKDGNVPVVSSSGITGRHSDAKATSPGVVTGRYGTIGEVFFIEQDYWPLNTALYVTNFKGNSPRFVAYFLRNILRNYQSDKSAVPGVNRNVLHEIQVSCPDTNVQKRIESILSPYDNLIENNRRKIQLLEQSARLLYKEWFVHLRFPGHEHVKIKNGIPEGWAKGTLSDFYSTTSGGTPSRKIPDFYTGDIPWVKTQELSGGFIFSTDEKITADALKASSAKLFPRHTVLVAMYGATIGQTAILSIPSSTNQACCAFTPQAPGTSFAHIYLFLAHQKNELIGLGQGAAQKNVSQQIIKSIKMCLPTERLLEHFSEATFPLFNQMETLQKINTNLEKARDLLLPRLMTGELAV